MRHRDPDQDGPGVGTPRMYHSTAALLPDGKIIVAGGNVRGGCPNPPGYNPTDTNCISADYYKPPPVHGVRATDRPRAQANSDECSGEGCRRRGVRAQPESGERRAHCERVFRAASGDDACARHGAKAAPARVRTGSRQAPDHGSCGSQSGASWLLHALCDEQRRQRGFGPCRAIEMTRTERHALCAALLWAWVSGRRAGEAVATVASQL